MFAGEGAAVSGTGKQGASTFVPARQAQAVTAIFYLRLQISWWQLLPSLSAVAAVLPETCFCTRQNQGTLNV